MVSSLMSYEIEYTNTSTNKLSKLLIIRLEDYEFLFYTGLEADSHMKALVEADLEIINKYCDSLFTVETKQ
jgi:hypothetical protein